MPATPSEIPTAGDAPCAFGAGLSTPCGSPTIFRSEGPALGIAGTEGAAHGFLGPIPPYITDEGAEAHTFSAAYKMPAGNRSQVAGLRGVKGCGLHEIGGSR